MAYSAPCISRTMEPQRRLGRNQHSACKPAIATESRGSFVMRSFVLWLLSSFLECTLLQFNQENLREIRVGQASVYPFHTEDLWSWPCWLSRNEMIIPYLWRAFLQAKQLYQQKYRGTLWLGWFQNGCVEIEVSKDKLSFF